MSNTYIFFARVLWGGWFHGAPHRMGRDKRYFWCCDLPGVRLVPSGTESYNTVHSTTDKSIYVNDNVQPNPIVCGYSSCSFGKEIRLNNSLTKDRMTIPRNFAFENLVHFGPKVGVH